MRVVETYIFADSKVRSMAVEYLIELQHIYNFEFYVVGWHKCHGGLYPKDVKYSHRFILPIRPSPSEDEAIKCINRNYMLAKVEHKTINVLPCQIIVVNRNEEDRLIFSTLTFISRFYETVPLFAHYTRRYFSIDIRKTISELCREIAYKSYTDKSTLLGKAIIAHKHLPYFEDKIYFGVFADIDMHYGPKIDLAPRFFNSFVVGYNSSTSVDGYHNIKPYDFIKLCYELYNRYEKYVVYYGTYGILFGVPAFSPIDDSLLEYTVKPLMNTLRYFDVDLEDTLRIFYRHSPLYKDLCTRRGETGIFKLDDAFEYAVRNIKKGETLSSSMIRVIASRIAEYLRKEVE